MDKFFHKHLQGEAYGKEKVDSLQEIVDQLVLVQPMQVWAQEEQPRCVSPLKVELQAMLLAQGIVP